MNIAEAKMRLTIPILWEILGLPGEPAESCCSPFREDAHPSFSIFAQGTRYYDHGEGDGGDAVDFQRRGTGLSKPANCRMFIKLAVGRPVVVDAVVHDRASSGRAPADRPGPISKKFKAPPSLPKMLGGTDPKRLSLLDEWLERLAKRRHVSRAAVDLAHQRGLLQFCYVKVPGRREGPFDWLPKGEELAWVITDSRRVNAQMRFLDGSPWHHLPGTPKAKTWQGSWASWPVGAPESVPFPTVLLVEGGPDFLAACHFIAAAGGQDSMGVVAVMGANMHIHEEALPLFADKRVRIYPHADEAGGKAAERWGDQLRAAGAEVDAFDLSGLRKADGTAVKDLNDCCLIHPDDAAELEGLLP